MSHVASLLASAVIPVVANKLGSVIGDEVTMLCSFKNDLKELKDTLEYMEAALKDAERRSVTEELVRLWLKRLKNAAYDISYMLDEFQANREPTSRKIIGKLDCFAIAPKVTMAYKMKNMRGRNISKDDLIHQWIALGFIQSSNNFSAIQLGEKYVRQFMGMSFLQHSRLHKKLQT
ncbi:hypothetical protein ZWY2020_029507 [Hordeum vulgare]|nr:hypothetical protein ZWY2020_029507 [Hordeum vulgare]